jgi:hypothetical protein
MRQTASGLDRTSASRGPGQDEHRHLDRREGTFQLADFVPRRGTDGGGAASKT